jgi:hypothetical protein
MIGALSIVLIRLITIAATLGLALPSNRIEVPFVPPRGYGLSGANTAGGYAHG